MPPAIRYGIDALLILVPLVVLMYFLFDPAAFNAFTAWLARVSNIGWKSPAAPIVPVHRLHPRALVNLKIGKVLGEDND